MNLTKALKRKKKLATQVSREFDKLRKYNSSIETSKVTYDPEESYKSWKKLSEELVELKTKIIQATAPIYGKIFQMNEYKSQISQLQNLTVTEGEVKRHYDDTPITYKAFITELKRDEEIEELEDKIDVIQAEIEIFNSTTSI